MTDLTEFFRQTETEIDATRKAQEQEQQKKKQAGFLLNSQLEIEWKQLAETMESKKPSRSTLMGKDFFGLVMAAQFLSGR